MAGMTEIPTDWRAVHAGTYTEVLNDHFIRWCLALVCKSFTHLPRGRVFSNPCR